MYGETPDMSGGFGQEGVDAFAKFLEGGGTLIAAGNAVRFPIEFGWARTFDTETPAGVTAQRPLVQSEIVAPIIRRSTAIRAVAGDQVRGRPRAPIGRPTRTTSSRGMSAATTRSCQD